MILNQNNRNIERGGIRVEREATIVADAVAFKVLSDMLYPDKPLAIIRELMCNAYDSHTAAGKPDEPVHIHLPNIMEPYLSIRDFGLGLSFRDACVLMLTYFKSTKRDNNSVTGALGLGSKTPFSYVDSYTVTTRYNGRKFTFNAFINENGNPAMALLARERTTECNGVEIMVPVRRNDFNVFIDRARSVLEWFRVPPVVTGHKDFKINKTEYETLGKTWKIGKQQGYWSYHGTAYAIQGNIAYPIKVESMPELPPGYAELLRMPIYMEFPIGEISFTAGRDAISYDKATVANLIAGLDRVVTELPQQSQTKFDACKTEWEARALYTTLINNSMSGSIIRVLNQHRKLSFKWKNQIINTGGVDITMKDYVDPVVTVLFGGSNKSRRHISHEPVSIVADLKTVFYIDDLPKGGITRLRSYRAANTPDHDLFLLSTAETDLTERRASIDKMLKELGDPEYKLVSTLPPKKRNPANVLSRKTNKILIVNSASYYGNQFETASDDIDFDEGGYYVAVQRGKALDSKGAVHLNFGSMIRQAATLKLIADGTEIVGVNPSQLKKFKDNDDWIDVTELLKEKFNDHLSKSKVVDEIAMATEYNQVQYTGARHYAYMFQHNSKILDGLDPNHPIVEFNKQYTKQSKATKSVDVNSLTTLAGWLGIDIDTKGGTAYKFSQEWDKIVDQYPLIKVINYPNVDMWKHILKYVQDTDRLAEYDKQPTTIKIQKPKAQP